MRATDGESQNELMNWREEGLCLFRVEGECHAIGLPYSFIYEVGRGASAGALVRYHGISCKAKIKTLALQNGATHAEGTRQAID